MGILSNNSQVKDLPRSSSAGTPESGEGRSPYLPQYYLSTHSRSADGTKIADTVPEAERWSPFMVRQREREGQTQSQTMDLWYVEKADTFKITTWPLDSFSMPLTNIMWKQFPCKPRLRSLNPLWSAIYVPHTNGTGLPAYSDTSYSDTVRSSPLAVTLFRAPNWTFIQ